MTIFIQSKIIMFKTLFQLRNSLVDHISFCFFTIQGVGGEEIEDQ